ncbi:unnamed protein product [Alopecurus aequalis]
MGAKQSIETCTITTHDELERNLDDENATPISLPFELLKDITCNFSTESILGQGGYGVVYKGLLRSGRIIAVKKLFDTHIKDEMFRNEISNLMEMKHQNVVRFIGYCVESKSEAIEEPIGSRKYVLAERPKRLLCFEYVTNQSLDKHISDESFGLEWNMRYEIIKGICNGLHFLHEQCHIVHLDLKPENILMDSIMTPKISDFGLSRIFGEQQTRIVTSNPIGTRGYMAPEYLIQGVISNKADIFSLGVIIVEIITGRRDYPYFQEDITHSTATSYLQFTDNVLGSWRNKYLSAPKCKQMERYIRQVRQCITIALKSVNPCRENRPTTKGIIQMLNEVDEQANPPLTHIISTGKIWKKNIVAIDFNTTEPWILTYHFGGYFRGSGGYLDIWNYDTHESMGSLQISHSVWSAKFIDRKELLVAGSASGSIHVYHYKRGVKKITSITSFRASESPNPTLTTLAVHPTKPYVLSACGEWSACGKCIKLWDWDKNWECIQTYPESVGLNCCLTFNPNDSNGFASTSIDGTVKFWSLDSLTPNYTLSGHSGLVNCLDFFTRDDQKYLITGSNDRTAKIWDMRTQACIYTLQGFKSLVYSVFPHPSIPVLITGTVDGDIHLWSATNFRLHRILRMGKHWLFGYKCFIGKCNLSSNTAVIGYRSSLWMMEIHDEEPAASEGSN